MLDRVNWNSQFCWPGKLNLSWAGVGTDGDYRLGGDSGLCGILWHSARTSTSTLLNRK